MYAEEDKQKRERAELRNEADSLTPYGRKDIEGFGR